MIRFWKESRFGKYADKDGRTDEDNNDDADAGLLRKQDFVREQHLCITIGVLLLLSAAVLSFKSARKFKFWDKWNEHQKDVKDNSDRVIMLVCEVLAWKSGAVYTLQAAVRWFSRLETEGHKFTNHIFWVSFMSCMFCYVLGISAR